MLQPVKDRINRIRLVLFEGQEPFTDCFDRNACQVADVVESLGIALRPCQNERGPVICPADNIEPIPVGASTRELVGRNDLFSQFKRDIAPNILTVWAIAKVADQGFFTLSSSRTPRSGNFKIEQVVFGGRSNRLGQNAGEFLHAALPFFSALPPVRIPVMVEAARSASACR